MILSVKDRLLILGLKEMPRFGNILTLKIVTALMALIGFTEKEIADWEIVFSDGEEGRSNVKWNPTKAEVVDLDLTPGMVKVLVDAMESSQELSLDVVPLYDTIKAMMPEEKKK
jgi:hypothetical protein